jgi:CubicO group peptidase (beta-lactamase class C family)
LKLQAPTGSKFIYSDVNFILLGEIIRKVSGESVHEFSREQVFQPLGMKETGYLPDEPLRARAAPTQERDGHWMQGEVHDPRAFKLGGVAGHAGLFSTAEDMAIYAQMMLSRGEHQGARIMSPETFALMTRGEKVSSGIRGLGWDKRTGFSINRGEGLSDAAFGHGGFTGTVLWIDPELELFVIFLSNRVHPDGKGSSIRSPARLAPSQPQRSKTPPRRRRHDLPPPLPRPHRRRRSPHRPAAERSAKLIEFNRQLVRSSTGPPAFTRVHWLAPTNTRLISDRQTGEMDMPLVLPGTSRAFSSRSLA